MALLEIEDLENQEGWPLPVKEVIETDWSGEYREEEQHRYRDAEVGDIITDMEGFEVQVLSKIDPDWIDLQVLKVYSQTQKEGYFAGMYLFHSLTELTLYIVQQLHEFECHDKEER